MQISFNDHVGTSMRVQGMPCGELTDLVPSLGFAHEHHATMTAGGPRFCPNVENDVTRHATQASASVMAMGINCVSQTHAELAAEACEALPTLHTGCPGWG